eukprot:gnl/MRDRNA2_/MRDRNA2_35040_c0_seq1.p1 gnl/MRDRNA2_/MRDRNA2_35040_c0~~gnl/MRDRNA2_/MRDRNA2_35040_c0_seq1.p1  ORF type:complete len:381 (+),score=51.33 gnl/MRDRNA2_/MRDRNA2_35040_c0_seq1:91-1233(+)
MFPVPIAMPCYTVTGFLPIVVEGGETSWTAPGSRAQNSYAPPSSWTQNSSGPPGIWTQNSYTQVPKASEVRVRPAETTHVNQEDLQGQVDDNHVLKGPLWKTKMCRYETYGVCCRGDTCRFAHTEAELRQAPDFSKIAICPRVLHGDICDEPKCPYAHRADELRKPSGILKTKICRFWVQMGSCALGSRCRFAHGDCELGKTSPKTSTSGSPVIQTPSRTATATLQTVPETETTATIRIFPHLKSDSSDGNSGRESGSKCASTNTISMSDGAHKAAPPMWTWQYAATRNKDNNEFKEVVAEGSNSQRHFEAYIETLVAMTKHALYGMSPDDTPRTIPAEDSTPSTPDSLMGWKIENEIHTCLGGENENSSSGASRLDELS